MRLAIHFAWCAAAFACQIVEGPKITGKDLADANAVFANADPATIVAASPIPGVRRVMHAQELRRFAPNPVEVCFERATTKLTPEEILTVLQNIIEGQIEIVDYVRSPVPIGSIEFDRAGLNDAGLWRGRIRFDENRTAPIWARVRVTTEQTWIEAAELLPAGKPIEESQISRRTGNRSLFDRLSATVVIGRAPLRAIKPGEPVLDSMLTTPREVERGEKISVEVISGDARLSFDAVADSSGRAGESVLVKNPENGRRFQARVEAKGKVVIQK